MKHAIVLAIALMTVPATAAEPVVDIASNRELFLDHFLIDQLLGGATLKMHTPVLSNECSHGVIPLGAVGQYSTILHDGDVFRLYCRGEEQPGITWKQFGVEAYHRNELTFYAESRDGVQWTEPDLGLYQIDAYPRGNVVLAREIMVSHNFTPLIDPRPDAAPEERYKALGGQGAAIYKKVSNPDLGEPGLKAFVSADGLRWRKLREEPVIPGDWGVYDSQNVAFWSESEQQFVCYFRTFMKGLRSIGRTTSPDFINWTEPVAMIANEPDEHLYTNGTQPYFRAPQIYIALPTRFHAKRGSTTDLMLMSTRGGSRYDRTFKEAFIRPGIGEGYWGNRSNYAVTGIVPTSSTEMSIYVHPNRRYVLRTDGFSSVHASYEGGEMVTRPFQFTGDRLEVNYSTSAGGQVRVEVLDADGRPVPGLGLEQCQPLIGDQIEAEVKWTDADARLGSLAGTPVRLRFVMEDADLYSLRFHGPDDIRGREQTDGGDRQDR